MGRDDAEGQSRLSPRARCAGPRCAAAAARLENSQRQTAGRRTSRGLFRARRRRHREAAGGGHRPDRYDHRHRSRSGRHTVAPMPLRATLTALVGGWLCLVCPGRLGAQRPAAADLEAMPFAPKQYVAYRAPARLNIDGKIDEAGWAAAPWTDAFVDIEGDRRPRPRVRTRAKMLWDDEAFYVAAEMDEPDVWATLSERDSVIFRDNDFEIFIDPDGDTHAYYELEVNALATAWDLMLVKPYRDGGPAINAWDIAGLKVGVDVRGTLNKPGDRDEGWTVEIAMPWKSLTEAAADHKPPQQGDRWRVNFSRVEWDVDAVKGR